MAVKNINYLPSADSIDDDSLFVTEQSSVAMKVTGKQLKEYATEEFTELSSLVAEAADAAKRAETAASQTTSALNIATSIVSGKIYVTDIGDEDFDISDLDFTAYSEGDVVLVVGST